VKKNWLNWKYFKGNMAHACNPSYMEAEIRRITVWGQTGQIVQETTPSPK
jgi:hypothetical protein